LCDDPGVRSHLVPVLGSGSEPCGDIRVVHGVAELRGRTMRQRAAAVIAIAAPALRAELRGAANWLGYMARCRGFPC
jgi:acyl-CoA hydrolase